MGPHAPASEEVILGILEADKEGFLKRNPDFRPTTPIAPATGQFKAGDFVKFALNL